MRILFVLLFLLATSVQSNTLPTKEGKIFWDENLQESHEGDDFKVGLNNSAGHLGVNGHDILSVLHDNKYLFTPDFPVGIIDSGFYKNHADFHNLIKEILSTKSGSHGTGVASTFSVSEVQNNLGTHGIVNAKSLVLDYSDGERTNLSNYKAYDKDVKIITQSQTLNVCTSYRAFYENRTCWLGGDEYNEIDMINHVEALAPIRQHFIDNPNTLFVLAAGNSGVDASWNNGAVHYRYVAAEGGNPETVVFDPLDNLLVVAAVGYDGVLHDYSDYGESVDLAVISGVLAARCVDENGSYYAADNTEDGYGIYRQNSDSGNSGAPCDSTGYGNGNNAFNGTSAATPIAAGMSALLMNMDLAMNPARVKTLLTQYSSKATSRYTGACDENDICNTQSLTETSKDEIAIPNLNNAYTQEKAIMMIQARNDALKLNGLTTSVSNNTACMAIWNEGGSERTTHNQYKSYEAKFYGDRCLYFRGNSYIIDFDLGTRQAEYIYYTADNSNKYQEYMTFRNFVNNLQSAKTDETWRNGYGVTLNSDGNVSCITSDYCYNGNPTAWSLEKCGNIFNALTGYYPQDISYDVIHPSYSQCSFVSNSNQKVIEYNFKTGIIQVKTFFDYPIENILDRNNENASLSLFNYMINYANVEDVKQCQFGRGDTYKFGIYSDKIGVYGNGQECVLNLSYAGFVHFIYDKTLEKYMFVSYDSIPAELGFNQKQRQNVFAFLLKKNQKHVYLLQIFSQ